MKIIGPDSPQQTQQVKSNSPSPSDNGGDFGNMFQKVFHQGDSASTVQKSTSLSEPMAVQPFVPVSSGTSNLADKASQAIDLLESYSNALSDPRKSLKDIEPALSAFIDETESMYRDYTESDNDDAELKEVMDSLLRTARSEAVRFQRGDYLDS
jgi:hypothetical protein